MANSNFNIFRNYFVNKISTMTIKGKNDTKIVYEQDKIAVVIQSSHLEMFLLTKGHLDKLKERETDRQTDRQTETDIQTDRERERDRQTDRD